VTISETNRAVTLELVGRTVPAIWKSGRTTDLIRGILAIFVTITDKLHVNTVVALTPELTSHTLAVLCVKIHSLHIILHKSTHKQPTWYCFRLLINQLLFPNYTQFIEFNARI